jgi:hypothetical protein
MIKSPSRNPRRELFKIKVVRENIKIKRIVKVGIRIEN